MKKIDWQDWQRDIFEQASKDNKLILTFVTRDGCKLCDKMQNDEFGQIEKDLKDRFVFIKIDADKQADIAKYMQEISFELSNTKRGYPLSIFFAPDKTPLYDIGYATYHNSNSIMGLKESMELVLKGYYQVGDSFLQRGKEAIVSVNAFPAKITATKIDSNLIEIIKEQLIKLYDDQNGGFDDIPKFPRHQVLELAVDIYKKDQDSKIADIIKASIEKFWIGSLLDKSDNGFCQCCLDKDCQEIDTAKRLCNNVLSVNLLLRAAKELDKSDFTNVALDSIEFINNHMQIDGFYKSCKGSNQNILLAHNAMVVEMLLDASETKSHYKDIALDLLVDIQDRFMRGGQIYRYIGDGVEVEGLLDDYLYLASAMLRAYEISNEEHHKIKASEVINAMLKHFFNNGLWLYGVENDKIKAISTDGECPSSIGAATQLLQKASRLINSEYEKFYQRSIEINSYEIMRQPISVASLSRVALSSMMN